MVRANWDIFNAKFSGNREDTFQWFSYLLFCREVDKSKGLFGYFNQSVLETEPVLYKDRCIGWQAKYYSDKLGHYTDKIIDIINNLKKKYSEVKVLYFYTNQLWGEGKNNRKPKGLYTIEKLCKELDICIEWRDANYFDSEDVCIKNEDLAKYFFTLNDKVSNCFQKLKEHTERLLLNINYSIPYKTTSISLDRTQELKLLSDSNSQVTILHGEGGCGKTAIVKQYYLSKTNRPFLLLKAFELIGKSFDDIFYGCTEQEINDLFNGESEKVFVLDSAEKLINIPDKECYKELITFLLKSKWKIIVTTRNEYLDALIFEISNIFECSYNAIAIEKFTEKQLGDCFTDYKIELPSDLRLQKLIQNPFYLNLFLSNTTTSENCSYSDFKKRVWMNISNSSIDLINISVAKAKSGVFYIDSSEISKEKLDTMLNTGVLTKEDEKYFISHDLFEEIAIEKYIDKKFYDAKNYYDFLNSLGTALSIRRCYRNWLSEKYLNNNEEVITQSMNYALEDDNNSFWMDETLIAIMLSSSANFFFDLHKTKFLSDNLKSLKRIAIQLRLSCKVFNTDLLSKIGLSVSLRTIDDSLLKPNGQGWKDFIHFIYSNLDEIGIENIGFVLSVLSDWTKNNKISETTREAGLLALRFYEWIEKNNKNYNYRDKEQILFQIICDSSTEISSELIYIFDLIIKNQWKNYNDPYVSLVDAILTDYKYSTIYQSLPKEMLKLINFFWKKAEKKDEKQDFFHFRSDEVEDYYGIEREYTTKSFPPSAFKTPFWWLLKVDFKSTLDFLISFINDCVEKFNSTKKEYFDDADLIDVFVEKQTIKQHSSISLWNMHRGTEGAEPYLLQSIHMALEKFLLDEAKYDNNVDAISSCLLYILKNSKSVSLSSIVTSIVLAYPEKYYSIAFELFRNKDFFLLDFIRCLKEPEAETCYKITSDSRNFIFSNERLETCKQNWRKTNLEQLFFKLQLTKLSDTETDEEFKNRVVKMYSLLDKFYKDLPSLDKQNENDKKWRFSLLRMDTRRMEKDIKDENGKIFISFTPSIDEDLIKYKKENEKKNIILNDKYISLRLWATYQWAHDMENLKKYSEYENPTYVIKKIKELCVMLEEKPNADNLLFNRALPALTISCLIRDFSDQMSSEELSYCNKIVIEYSLLPFCNMYRYQVSDGTENAIFVLGKAFLNSNNVEEKLDIIRLLLLNLFRDEEVGMSGKACREDAINSINTYIYDHIIKNKIIWGYIVLEAKWQEILSNNRQLLWQQKITKEDIIERFINENKNVFSKCIDESDVTITKLDIQKLSFSALYVLLFLIYTEKDLYTYLFDTVISQATFYLNKDKGNGERLKYMDKYRLAKGFALYLLHTTRKEIPNILNQLFNQCNDEDFLEMLYQNLIYTEDTLQRYDNFWEVWKISSSLVFNRKSSRILNSYLFATISWKENSKNWHSFKNENKSFFLEISKEKTNMQLLYPFTKLLYGIGSIYRSETVNWIFNIIENNSNCIIDEATKFYLETVIRTYIYDNYAKISKLKMLKEKTIHILNFMINQNSVVAYMLRDNIL